MANLQTTPLIGGLLLTLAVAVICAALVWLTIRSFRHRNGRVAPSRPDPNSRPTSSTDN